MLADIDTNTFKGYFQIFADIVGSWLAVCVNNSFNTYTN